MINTFTNADKVTQESKEPTIDAIAPSRMNGSRMVQFEAPTKRMISVSVRRDAADMRIVVPVSIMATTTITAANAAVAMVARFSTANTGSKNLPLITDSIDALLARKHFGNDLIFLRILQFQPQ